MYLLFLSILERNISISSSQLIFIVPWAPTPSSGLVNKGYPTSDANLTNPSFVKSVVYLAHLILAALNNSFCLIFDLNGTTSTSLTPLVTLKIVLNFASLSNQYSLFDSIKSILPYLLQKYSIALTSFSKWSINGQQ